MYSFNWLTDQSDKILQEIFNLSFSDYLVPMQLDDAQFSRKILLDRVSKNLSIGAFFQNELVGIVLIGHDGKKLYNSATGVIPKHRGHQLTQKMYHWAIPKWKGLFETIQLEVITENIPAIKSYEQIGFLKNRVVTSYKGQPQFKLIEIPNYIRFEEVDCHKINSLRHHLYFIPTWQNQFHIFETSPKDFSHWILYYNNQLAGFYSIQSFNSRIIVLHIESEFRHIDFYNIILSHLHHLGHDKLFFLNVDKNDQIVNNWIQTMHLEKIVQQFEMMYKL